MSKIQYTCPTCDKTLDRIQLKQGVVWGCPQCKGRTIGFALLQNLSRPELLGPVWRRARQENRRIGKRCASCRHPCLVVDTGPELGSMELDVCVNCQFLWFDPQELEKIPRATDEEIAARTAPAVRPDPLGYTGLPPALRHDPYAYQYREETISFFEGIFDSLIRRG